MTSPIRKPVAGQTLGQRRNRHEVHVAALAASGWTIVSGRGSGAVTHPSMPGHIFTIGEAVVHIRRGLMAAERPTIQLTAPWPTRPLVPDPEDPA